MLRKKKDNNKIDEQSTQSTNEKYDENLPVPMIL